MPVLAASYSSHSLLHFNGQVLEFIRQRLTHFLQNRARHPRQRSGYVTTSMQIIQLSRLSL